VKRSGGRVSPLPDRFTGISMEHEAPTLNRRRTPAEPIDGLEARDNVSGTVLRALRLLDVLVAEPRGLGLTAAAARGGLNKATAFRMLGSLQRAGLVVQDPATGHYRPGMKLVRMAEQVLEALDFRTVAHSYVERLAEEIGHGVLAGVLEGPEVVYVDHVEGSGGLRVHRQVGGRRSVHVSSIGKAILAHLPPAEAEATLDACRFERRTERTITDRAALLADLETARRRGWAEVRDEDVLGATSVSAPVFDHTNRVIGAIGFTGPSFALQGPALERSVQLLITACRAASAELGHIDSAGAAVLGTSGRSGRPAVRSE
jgi:IclR family KDG regulon transcriptional repressor